MLGDEPGGQVTPEADVPPKMGKHVPPGIPKREERGGQPSSPGRAPNPRMPTRGRLCCPMNSYAMMDLLGASIVPTIFAMPKGYHRERTGG